MNSSVTVQLFCEQCRVLYFYETYNKRAIAKAKAVEKKERFDENFTCGKCRDKMEEKQ